jgi:glycosyltransferase involved in cell wall biosynthesis
MTETKRYVLVTPAKNEEKTLGFTIESVTNQTILPVEWIIVSDGSTDQTENIVKDTASKHPWVRLLALQPRGDRNFGAVVLATSKGVAALATADYDYIGLLDSDVRFQQNYFEEVMASFAQNPRLGLAGGVVIDAGTSRDRIPRNQQDVPGAVQFFRKECFDAIGQLLPVPEGGWDGLACAQARMKGFETRLLTNLVVDHLKPRNVSEGGWLRRRWQMGVRDYAVGYHPLFEFVKCFGRLCEKPFLLGGLAWWFGYCCAVVQRRPATVPMEVRAHLRREQMARLFGMVQPGTMRKAS